MAKPKAYKIERHEALGATYFRARVLHTVPKRKYVGLWNEAFGKPVWEYAEIWESVYASDGVVYCGIPYHSIDAKFPSQEMAQQAVDYVMSGSFREIVKEWP